MAANARAAIGPDIGRVCAVQVKRETAARGGREGMRVQTLWNLLEVVLPVTVASLRTLPTPMRTPSQSRALKKSSPFYRSLKHSSKARSYFSLTQPERLRTRCDRSASWRGPPVGAGQSPSSASLFHRKSAHVACKAALSQGMLRIREDGTLANIPFSPSLRGFHRPRALC